MSTEAFLQQDILERFLRYTKIDTRSDEHASCKPSSPGQWDLIHLLEKELEELGIEDQSTNEDGFLIARVPSNLPDDTNVPAIGFMAHVDTSPDMPGNGVKAQLIEAYDGKDIRLNDQYSLKVEENPILLEYVGRPIITTDGTTLLGSDDKAGVAEIMAVLRYLKEHPEMPHGPIEIIFTCDEETGHGMDRFPVEQLRSRCCYTLDGGRRGEVEYECFNAAKVRLTFDGVMIHPGSARGVMVNALTMATRFCSLIPQAESPETTDGLQGYYYLDQIEGDSLSCTLWVNLRDFEAEGLKRRKEVVRAAAQAVEAASGTGRVTMEVIDQYKNMREYIQKDPLVTQMLLDALKRLQIPALSIPIRGGTDGSRLSEMGIPTPNIFTGGHNMHSRYEWAAVDTMVEASAVMLMLIELWCSHEA